ncbi:hypothetical protein KK062_23930 [Fulvivirgaceae bacterium PWU5]|uniref:Dipeptidylpeptidase IV N-terminal domain-containing protein n=1 Tax=Dawidia cretensis TaxID=2782350 RepID=A0AAP2GVS9_9BACT|nr:hypothetical protein [Dawidia cretensis]MBT1711313.1 hypothetical protein [Dawidia cretensis]
MKTQKLLILILTLWTTNAYCQDGEIQTVRKQILEEGLFLFRLEKASWNSTDLLVKDHSTLVNQVAGYVSYPANDDTKTIFWNTDGKILFTVTLDSTGAENKSIVDVNIRTATQQEAELIKLRKDAFDFLTKNEDNFFAFYKNTSRNLVPFIKNDQRAVFILTASREKKLLIGNDYRLLFNDKNEVIKKEKLHNSLITINQDAKETNEVGSMHTHILEDHPYMTSTDICTFMLYREVFKLKNHVVISDKGTSIFESEKKNLIIVPQDRAMKK